MPLIIVQNKSGYFFLSEGYIYIYINRCMFLSSNVLHKQECFIIPEK